jgi:hypothetical protein
MKFFNVLALGSILGASLVLAQAPAATGTSPSPTATKTTKPAPASAPSAADIANAKSKGLVWANLNTKVYHYSTDSVYGNTKNGKFLTEADAKAAGYRAAKQGAVKSKTVASK